ncbi:MAG TPA: 5'-methylthioadenosine/adenosylhomocysteine nucleosidase [Candidatus Kapabacteria bacterium]|nr:5'-methylthioadenosine/adenosylhomocysteine nucleosidase [Candidatus Kapabacteria bacterium]
MRIGIMGAMVEEVQHLVEGMRVEQKELAGSKTYYRGELWGRDCVLAFSKWGKVAAASTATTMLDRMGCDLLIFTGVAGSARQDIRIGDVVIADRLIQHDMDVTASRLFEKFEVPGLGRKYFDVEPRHVELTQQAAQEFLDLDTDLSTHLAPFEIKQPRLHIGTIASGDQFIGSAAKLAEMRDEIDGLACVEMEGAAVAQVAFEHKVPVIVIRSISDNADHSAHVDFPKFVEQVASYYSHGIVKNLLKTL